MKILILIKEYSNKHVLHCKNNRYIFIDNDCITIYSIFDISLLNTDEFIYTNNKKELLLSLNLEKENNIIDLSIFTYIKTKKENTYFTQLYDKFNNFYNNKLYLIPDIKLIELIDIISIKQDIPNIEINNFINNTVVETIIKIEKGNIVINNELLEKYKNNTYNYLIENNIPNIISNYTLLTKTLRPTNNIYSFNFMSLNKSNNERELITSQYKNGILIEIDFNAYHLNILSKLLNVDLPKPYNNWHEYLGKEYYFKTDNLTEEQYKETKIKNFRYLYSLDRNTNIDFFIKVNKFAIDLFNNYKGYITSPIHKIKNYISDENISDNKLFNYFIQLLETEISFIIMNKIFNILNNDNDIKLIMYNYDSLLFDINIENENNLIKFKKIINYLNKNNFSFKKHLYKQNYSQKI